MFDVKGQTKSAERKSNADRWFSYGCTLAFVLALALLGGLLVRATGIPDAPAILGL